MKLRYVGAVPVVFTHPAVGEVFPGQEFEVPDGDAEGLLAHGLVERALVKPLKELPAASPAPVAVALAVVAAAETV
jgi:hypothetical protein